MWLTLALNRELKLIKEIRNCLRGALSFSNCLPACQMDESLSFSLSLSPRPCINDTCISHVNQDRRPTLIAIYRCLCKSGCCPCCMERNSRVHSLEWCRFLSLYMNDFIRQLWFSSLVVEITVKRKPSTNLPQRRHARLVDCVYILLFNGKE